MHAIRHIGGAFVTDRQGVWELSGDRMEIFISFEQANSYLESIDVEGVDDRDELEVVKLEVHIP